VLSRISRPAPDCDQSSASLPMRCAFSCCSHLSRNHVLPHWNSIVPGLVPCCGRYCIGATSVGAGAKRQSPFSVNPRPTRGCAALDLAWRDERSGLGCTSPSTSLTARPVWRWPPGSLQPLAARSRCAVPPRHHREGRGLAAPSGRQMRSCPTRGPLPGSGQSPGGRFSRIPLRCSPSSM
jgi:hypothetical protein